MDTKTKAIKGALAALTQNATFPADVALAVKILQEADAAPADPVMPELLAALKACYAALQLVERETGNSYGATVNAAAAIARAKGK